MKFVQVYPWRVLETIAEGKTVYVLDKKRRSVHVVNNAPCGDVVKALEGEEKGRFEYWYEEADSEEIPEYEVDNGEL